jgi:hypothetical protein
MTISVVQSNPYTESGSPGTSHVLSGLTTTAGNPILVAVGYRGLTGGAVSDSVGNEYYLLGAAISGATYVELWGTKAAIPTRLLSGSITVTSIAACGVAFRMFELSGTQMPLTNWISGTIGKSQAAATAMSSVATGASINTTDLCICAFATDGAATVSSSTFSAGAATATNTDSSTTTGSVVQLTTAYRLITVVTTQTYSATLGTARAIASLITRVTANNGSFSTVMVSPVLADDRSFSMQIITPIVTTPDGVVGQFIPPVTEIDRV